MVDSLTRTTDLVPSPLLPLLTTLIPSVPAPLVEHPVAVLSLVAELIVIPAVAFLLARCLVIPLFSTTNHVRL